MVIEKILCDRCKKEVNGKGFSVSAEVLDDRFRLTVTPSLDETGGEHYCGKQCLLLALNEMVDEVSKREGRPAGAGTALKEI